MIPLLDLDPRTRDNASSYIFIPAAMLSSGKNTSRVPFPFRGNFCVGDLGSFACASPFRQLKPPRLHLQASCRRPAYRLCSDSMSMNISKRNLVPLLAACASRIICSTSGIAFLEINTPFLYPVQQPSPHLIHFINGC